MTTPTSDVRVAPVGHKAALYAVEHWHYSGTIPVPPRITLGVWEHGKFIGAVIFSRGNAPYMGDRWGLVQGSICELTRVALAPHETPVSQIVALALRWLKQHNPGMRLVVSYADPSHGHHGGIYQAGNWMYVGESTPTPMYRDKAGKLWHSRQVSATGLKQQFGSIRRVPKASDCEKVTFPGKYLYVYPLDKAMRRKAAKQVKPAPAPVTA